MIKRIRDYFKRDAIINRNVYLSELKVFKSIEGFVIESVDYAFDSEITEQPLYTMRFKYKYKDVYDIAMNQYVYGEDRKGIPLARKISSTVSIYYDPEKEEFVSITKTEELDDIKRKI